MRKRSKRSGYVRLTLIPLLWGGVNTKTAAAPPLEAENHTLQPMTVIATRTERPRAELPASISTLDREQIRLRQPQSMDDLMQLLPNVDFAIDNLANKAYRRHLSVIEEAGRNFKVSLSYQF
jgi:outer membrane receptor protein involved in Fe transport